MTDFSRLLNPEQCEAATSGDGPLLVLAAAGTGKTRTLVHRVAYLVERGVPAERVMLLTFTNRAAREMLERACKVVGPDVSTIWSGTFHHVCSRLLRRYGGCLGYNAGFQIIDEDDQRKLIGEAIKEVAKDAEDFPKKEVVAKMISEAANESKPVEAVAARWMSRVAGVDPDGIAKVAAAYTERKKALSSMDFDDLLVNGLRLLRENDRVREMLQEHFVHVLVDEYQDTNPLQAEFVDIMAAGHGNVMAVGDDFQCIYTWRGAHIENIMEFPKRWPGCKIVKLERNYRSVPGVLDVANVVMKDASNQFGKTLRPIRSGAGDLPELCRVYDGKAQANEIVRMLSRMRDAGYRYGDMAVLYRSHFHSVDLQMTLARTGVPFRITSGIGVFEQMHTKDVLAYLRLLRNPSDELSFMRLVRLLPGVGEKAAQNCWKKLSGRFDGRSEDGRLALSEALPARSRSAWESLSSCFAEADALMAEERLGEIIGSFCDGFYADHLRRSSKDDDVDDRLDDLGELASQIASYEGGLDAFLSDVALMTNLDVRDGDSDSDKVTLSTVHQAKGMEWPVVALPWLSAGMFPSSKAAEEGRLDEERRLFYVAVTRAKDKLFMYTPQMRKMADGGMFPLDPSEFVKEIPAELVEQRRVSDFSGGYSGGYGRGGYGGGYGRSGYGGGYGGGHGGGYGGPRTIRTTTWRR